MAFLGASRGLGRAVALEMDKKQNLAKALLISRSQEKLDQLGSELNAPAESLSLDFSKQENFEDLVSFLKKGNVQRIFYFAAGGPYGLFSKKQWKDHQWAMQVSFLTPAELLHRCVHQRVFPELKQFVVVGSQIADSSADPNASSYSAAKHALKGLVDSIVAEKDELDVRIFRPGYIDTDMLPANAAPRRNGSKISNVAEAASNFATWVLDSNGAKTINF